MTVTEADLRRGSRFEVEHRIDENVFVFAERNEFLERFYDTIIKSVMQRLRHGPNNHIEERLHNIVKEP